MKISNSKKQLAKIISENGGWPNAAEFAVQGRETMLVGFSKKMPYRRGRGWFIKGETPVATFKAEHVITNWHQTILSRDEYFHLYPASDADGWIEWKWGECPVEKGALVDVRYRDGVENSGVAADALAMGGSARRGAFNWSHDFEDSGWEIVAYRPHKPEAVAKPARIVIEPEPTIEQLAANYRAKLAIAQQAQEEADSHRCGAEAALEKLVAAGKALGLVLNVAAQEPALVITDWRHLLVGDVIWVGDSGHDSDAPAGEYTISEVDFNDQDQPVGIDCRTSTQWPCIRDRGWRFIRRP